MLRFVLEVFAFGFRLPAPRAAENEWARISQLCGQVPRIMERVTKMVSVRVMRKFRRITTVPPAFTFMGETLSPPSGS